MRLKNKLILASGSPRRRQLISYLFENTESFSPPLQEPEWQNNEKPDHYLKHCTLAKLKASAGFVLQNRRDLMNEEGTLLVADTMVVLGSEVLGKPSSSQDAENKLKKLSGKAHLVWTGFRLLQLKDLKRFLESEEESLAPLQKVETKVCFRELKPREIRDYVNTQEPMDKAGAYGFQGVGMQLIREMQGSYTNVVGLPLEALKEAAERIHLA